MATLGTSEHSRKRKVWTMQVVLINSYFLDFESDKIHKKILDFRLAQSELFENIRRHFHFLMLDSALVYTGIH